MKQFHRTTSKRRQSGVLASSFALIMIIVLALTVFTTSGSALTSQRTANTDNRVGQALEAAEAGLDLALAKLRSTRIPYASFSQTLPNGTSFIVTIKDSGVYRQGRYTVVSRGSSIDKSAMRTVRQTFALLHLLHNAPETPLITRKSVSFQGAATIVNREGFTTIWSGGHSGFGSSSNGGTWIDPKRDGKLRQSTSGNGYGGDVVLDDITIANLNDDEFYYTFMGVPRSKLYEMSTKPNSNVIWLSSNNDTIKIAGNAVFGSPTTPVIVYIDGNADITGTPQFYGLVYVRGDFGKAGTANIYGAVVVEGNTEFSAVTGNLEVSYDSELLSKINSGSPYVSGIPGSWKDF